MFWRSNFPAASHGFSGYMEPPIFFSRLSIRWMILQHGDFRETIRGSYLRRPKRIIVETQHAAFVAAYPNSFGVSQVFRGFNVPGLVEFPGNFVSDSKPPCQPMHRHLLWRRIPSIQGVRRSSWWATFLLANHRPVLMHGVHPKAEGLWWRMASVFAST